MRKTKLMGIAIGAVAALSVMIAPVVAAGADGAKLSVLHGIPDTPVDVYVNGDLTLDDFQPGDLAGPLDLPAGDYEVALTASDATDASDPILGPATVSLAAGKNHTAVAHLDESGAPSLKAFLNDTTPTAAGEGRLTVRHVAAAPAVDVLADGSAAVESLKNPDEATLDLAPGTISAAVAAAGTTDPVLGPADVTVAEGALTVVYAWGSLADENLAVAVQTIPGLHSAPSGVPSGSGGQMAAAEDGGQMPLLIGSVVLLAALAGGIALAARSRRSQR